MTIESSVHVVILAGGSGTRFWPLSRKARPKQLIALEGDTTMIAQTVTRVASLTDPSKISIVCGRPLANPTLEAVAALGVSQLYVEPQARNTAPAIALAAAQIAREHPNAIMAVFPSDHYVKDDAEFRRCVMLAAEEAERGAIVTLGISPTRPDTGFGYIEFEGKGDVSKVRSFVEKPDLATAKSYLASGNYVWNAGIFVMKVGTLLNEFQRQHPSTYEAFTSVRDAAEQDLNDAVIHAFETAEATSIDYAIMENAENVMVVPADCGWSDVGHWAALPEIQPADPEGNILVGNNIVSLKTKNSILVNRAADQVLAVSCLESMVVVQTQDAVLVVPRSEVQSVREVVDALISVGLSEFV